MSDENQNAAVEAFLDRVQAAEQYAQAALALVPYWHYVRDILMKQIQEAKSKSVAR